MIINRFLKNLIIILLVFSIMQPQNSWSQNGEITTESTDNFDDEAFEDDDFDDEDFADFELNQNSFKIYDPFEKYNRKIYQFNDVLDRYFLEYIAKFYRKNINHHIRKSIRNFLTNLTLPLSTVNSLAQGKFENSRATFSTFLINSTIGVFGLFNIATTKEIKYNREDFGQTLGHYGSGSGAYLVIPFLGPSSSRDFGGWVVDNAFDPMSFNVAEIGGESNLIADKYRISNATLTIIDSRENLIDIIDSLRVESFDPYATVRSAYLQDRRNQISK